MITISTPAKINLTLEVLGKRTDGYHEIRSVIQTISLVDTLRFEEADELMFHSKSTGWIAEKSLVSRATDLMRITTGTTKGAKITVDKHIPILSGLGGDSSDAAATLIGLNSLWNLGLDYEQIIPLARQLGSDVAFFLDGGTALATGRGEKISILPIIPHQWIVLAVPAVPRMQGKTGLLYNNLTTNHYTDGRITERLVEALESGLGFDYSMMFNVFEGIAYDIYPGFNQMQQRMKQMGATNIHLAGSGPTLFSLYREKMKADELYLRLKKQGLETFLVETQAIG